MKSFKIINKFLTEEEKKFFLSEATKDDFVKHICSNSGEESPFQFRKVPFLGIERASIMKMEPYTTANWHVDGADFNRKTLIIHPLTGNYAPCLTKHGSVDCPIILDTQQVHSIINNSHLRVNFQIPLTTSFSELMNNAKHPDWKLINMLTRRLNVSAS